MSERPGARWIIAIVLALVAVRLFAGAQLPTSSLPLPVDDVLYARHAESIAEGRWLGDYDHEILTKRPGYGAFLAGARWFGVPRRLAEDLLQIAACLALFAALGRCGLPATLRAAAFTVVLFHPCWTAETSGRLIREGVHASQTLLVLAAVIAIVTATSTGRRLVHGALLGLLMAWTWQTRSEAAWLAAPVALGLAATAVVTAKRYGWGRGVTETLLVTALLGAPVAASEIAVRELNRHYYGAAVSQELTDGPFTAAAGALQRVARSRPRQYEPLDGDLREAIYRVSPAFAELRDYIESDEHAGPSMLTEGERMSVYLMWALRDAAAHAGHHETLPRARAFYRRLADEVGGACDAGLLPDGGGSGYLARIRILDGAHALRCVATCASELMHPRHAGMSATPRWPASSSPPAVRSRHERVLGRDLHQPLDAYPARWRMLERAATVTTLVVRILALPALLLTAWAVIARSRRRRPFAATELLAVLFFATVAARVAVVTVFETWWFGEDLRYLVPAYPCFAAGVVCALGGVFATTPARGVSSFVERHAVVRNVLGAGALLAVVAWVVLALARPTQLRVVPPGLLDGADIELDVVAVREGALIERTPAGPRISGGPLRLQTVDVRALEGRKVSFDVEVAGIAGPAEIRIECGTPDGVRARRFPVMGAGRAALTLDPGHPVVFALALTPPVDASLVLRAIRVVPEDAPRSAPELAVLFDPAAGRLEVTVHGGEPSSVYEVGIGERLLDEALDLPGVDGSAFLDPEGLRIPDLARGIRLLVITDPKGSGTASLAVDWGDSARVELFSQALGPTTITGVARVASR